MSILLEHADILIRSQDGYDCIKDGYLGISGKVIDYIGKDEPKQPYDEKKNLHNKLLMPGLINTHSHIAMVLLRGIGYGLPLHDWLFEAVFPIENRLIPEDVADASRYAFLEMLAGGTTSYSDMYLFPEQTILATGEAGIKANLCRSVDCFDKSQKPEEYFKISESVDFFKKYHRSFDDRIRMDFSLHAEYTNTEPVVRYYSEQCKQNGGRMHIHLAETAREQAECIEHYGVTPTQWFERNGTFDSPTAAAHCVAVTPEDMDILARHDVGVIHNPTSNMKLGSGFAPVREMMDRGITIGLGTDGTSSNNNLNMFEEMHLASILHNGYHQDSIYLAGPQILDMATINGAKIQGRDNTGVLAVGKAADIIAIDLDKPHLYPNFDVVSLLIYSAQASDVCMTMVDGKILYENGEYKTIDEEKVRFNMKKAVGRLYEIE